MRKKMANEHRFRMCSANDVAQLIDATERCVECSFTNEKNKNKKITQEREKKLGALNFCSTRNSILFRQVRPCSRQCDLFASMEVAGHCVTQLSLLCGRNYGEESRRLNEFRGTTTKRPQTPTPISGESTRQVSPNSNSRPSTTKIIIIESILLQLQYRRWNVTDFDKYVGFMHIRAHTVGDCMLVRSAYGGFFLALSVGVQTRCSTESGNQPALLIEYSVEVISDENAFLTDCLSNVMLFSAVHGRVLLFCWWLAVVLFTGP